MPYYYKGDKVTKEVWDTISPELKKKIIKEGNIRMDDKVLGLYVVKDQFGVDKQTGRLMALIRVEIEKMSVFYCYASCQSLDLKTVEPKDFKIEFLENSTWNTKHVPYNADLFRGVLDMATEVFLEITENEKISTAV